MTNILKKTPYFLPYILRMKNPFPIIKSLEESQWWSYEKILELQLNKFKKIFKHSLETVPFYSKLYKDYGVDINSIKTLEDISKLPTINKNDLQNNLSYFTSTIYKSSELHKSATGGSTGEPVQFYIDKHSIWKRKKPSEIRCFKWQGYEFGMRRVILWGALRDLKIHKSILDRFKNLLFNDLFINVFDINEDKIIESLKVIEKYNPEVIYGYTTALKLFSYYVKEEKISLTNLHCIITSATTLNQNDRILIEEAFKVSVFDQYGCREIGYIAGECEHHSGLHINAENVIVEFLPAREDKSINNACELIITDLENFGMPFLRYRVGDLAIKKMNCCECGRGLPLIDKIIGRDLDYIVLPNQKYISGHLFTNLFKKYPIYHFSVYQSDKRNVVITLQPIHNKLHETDINCILRRLKSILGKNVNINLEIIDHIPTPLSGKLNFVISELSY